MTRRSFGALRKLPSGRWQASYTDERTGDRIIAPTTFTTKTDANLWLSGIATDRKRGRLLDLRLSERLTALPGVEVGHLGGIQDEQLRRSHPVGEDRERQKRHQVSSAGALTWRFVRGRNRRRSGDLPLFRRSLCQLSYPTVGCPAVGRIRPPERSRRDLNPRPPA
ncbi:MAG: site-specific integrase [Acidimicrobiales bacterium]|nr:site-specific integrase [Acidimicrobiales bacterium]